MASPRRLPKAARSLILDSANDVFYSAASVWEVAIKSALRRRNFKATRQRWCALAQSLDEPMTLLTNDALLLRYGPLVQLV